MAAVTWFFSSVFFIRSSIDGGCLGSPLVWESAPRLGTPLLTGLLAFCGCALTQFRHGRGRGILSFTAFVPALCLGYVVILSHATPLVNIWRLGTPALDRFDLSPSATQKG